MESKTTTRGRQAARGARSAAFAAIAAIALASSLPSCLVLAAPCTRPIGGVFVETRVDAFRSSDPNGFRFERLDVGTYGQWGVGPGTMIGAKIIYGANRSVGSDFAVAADGVVEVEGFAQRTVHESRNTVVSLRGAIARPASLEGGARPGLAADGVDVETRALLGATLRDGPGPRVFTAIEAAFRKRTGEAADQGRLDALIGIEPAAGLILLAEAQGVLSVGNEERGGADFDLVKLQPSVVWRATPQIALRAGGLIEVAARGLTPGRGAFIALWTEF